MITQYFLPTFLILAAVGVIIAVITWILNHYELPIGKNRPKVKEQPINLQPQETPSQKITPQIKPNYNILMKAKLPIAIGNKLHAYLKADYDNTELSFDIIDAIIQKDGKTIVESGRMTVKKNVHHQLFEVLAGDERPFREPLKLAIDVMKGRTVITNIAQRAPFMMKITATDKIVECNMRPNLEGKYTIGELKEWMYFYKVLLQVGTLTLRDPKKPEKKATLKLSKAMAEKDNEIEVAKNKLETIEKIKYLTERPFFEAKTFPLNMTDRDVELINKMYAVERMGYTNITITNDNYVMSVTPNEENRKGMNLKTLRGYKDENMLVKLAMDGNETDIFMEKYAIIMHREHIMTNKLLLHGSILKNYMRLKFNKKDQSLKFYLQPDAQSMLFYKMMVMNDLLLDT